VWGPKERYRKHVAAYHIVASVVTINRNATSNREREQINRERETEKREEERDSGIAVVTQHATERKRD